MIIAASSGSDGGATVAVAIVATFISAGSLVVSFIALRRSPKVLLVKEHDAIARVEGQKEAHRWTVKIVNRGRASATAIRSRRIEPSGTKGEWIEHEPLDQGDTLTLYCEMSAWSIKAISDPFSLAKGPAFDVEWRGAHERKKPFRAVFRPTEMGTKILS